MIAGAPETFDPLDDDVQYVFDLGLARREKGAIQPANLVYAEVICRTLNLRSQYELERADYPAGTSRYLVENRLDMSRLLRDFQAFWRENSEIWEERYEYKEAAPHLILMAFLQNILNGEGRVHREYATGRGRLDLCMECRGGRYPIELKIRHSARTVEEGRTQLSQYMDTMGCEEGWLVVFDRRKEVSWDEKVFWLDEEIGSKSLHITGC